MKNLTFALISLLAYSSYSFAIERAPSLPADKELGSCVRLVQRFQLPDTGSFDGNIGMAERRCLQIGGETAFLAHKYSDNYSHKRNPSGPNYIIYDCYVCSCGIAPIGSDGLTNP